MDNRLTVKQLQEEIKPGDWVWIVCDNGLKGYFKLFDTQGILDFRGVTADIGVSYDSYGETWIAYKNKEQAETKGEILELPCLRDLPTLYYHDKPVYRKELNYLANGSIISIPYSEDEFEVAEAYLRGLKQH